VTRLRYLLAALVDLPAGSGWLSDAERDTARSLRFAKRRRDWLLGRYTAKRALAVYEGVPDPSLARWEIRADGDGAPTARRDGRPLEVAISISHSHDRALSVVAPVGVAPGCDIERIEARGPEFPETFFTRQERTLISEARDDARVLLVTLIWSAKESALKSLRCGLREDTRSVNVRITSDGPASSWQPLLVDLAGSSATLPGWWRTDSGYVLTVAAGRPTGTPQRLPAEAAHPASVTADTRR
jgi:4'-phosphopantetheinyl transferase